MGRLACLAGVVAVEIVGVVAAVVGLATAVAVVKVKMNAAVLVGAV